MIATDGILVLDPTVYTGDGTTLDSPYAFLWQAIKAVYDGTHIDARKYEEVKVNIWVGKGVHHYFYCTSDWEDTMNSTISNACALEGMTYS